MDVFGVENKGERVMNYDGNTVIQQQVSSDSSNSYRKADGIDTAVQSVSIMNRFGLVSARCENSVSEASTDIETILSGMHPDDYDRKKKPWERELFTVNSDSYESSDEEYSSC